MSWLALAACRGAVSEEWDPWFPCAEVDSVASSRDKQWFRLVAEAKRVCGVCPVKVECLEFGLREVYGIYGGLSPIERRTVLRDRARGQMSFDGVA